jgi:hypothetical protein
LSKGRPDCLVARDIEVEFVKFGKPLPHLLGARSTSKFAKPEILERASLGYSPRYTLIA